MNFVIRRELKGKSYALFPDISEREMFEIGKMTVSWALLEHFVIGMIKFFSDQMGQDLPASHFENNSLDKNLKEFKSLLKKLEGNEEFKKNMNKLIRRIQDLKIQRHTLVHAIYSWDNKNPALVNAKTPKNKEGKYDADKIEKLADKIAELNFELHYPGGEDDYIEEMAQRGMAMSRSFAIMMSGSNTTDQTLHLPFNKKEKK